MNKRKDIEREKDSEKQPFQQRTSRHSQRTQIKCLFSLAPAWRRSHQAFAHGPWPQRECIVSFITHATTRTFGHRLLNSSTWGDDARIRTHPLSRRAFEGREKVRLLFISVAFRPFESSKFCPVLGGEGLFIYLFIHSFMHLFILFIIFFLIRKLECCVYI